MKKWTALRYDVSKMLAGAGLQRVKIEGLTLELTVELDDAAYAKLAKDPVWIQKMTDKANAKLRPALDRLIQKVKQADQKAMNFDAKTADIFTKDIDTTARAEMAEAGKQMAAEVDRLFEDYKKGQKELLKFRVKSGAKITMNGVAIVGAVAVAGATHGALAPASIVAIARSGIVIAQEVAKWATSADQIAVLIKGELKALGTFMSTNMANADVKKKIKQGAKEIGLGALSAVLGAEIPNLKNCRGHIEVHKVDISKLEKESHQLAGLIHGTYDEQAKWQAKVEKYKASLKEAKLLAAKAAAKTAAKILDHLIQSTIAINEAIERAKVRQEKFEEAINAMSEGLPGWIGYVQTAITVVVDVGLAVGGATTAIEQGLGALIAVEIDVGSELVDKV
ncbi:MAG TPA: hypothetical protein VH253_04395 [Phycisphaerae bacterium]|nr:hypothetical protein [Phycisphaerae bacterium]